MPSDVALRGVYLPVITPFAADGSVAADALAGLCHEFLDAGGAGIVALGTTGESTALDTHEKQVVVETCARVCAERSAQLIVGAGTNNTAATVATVQSLEGTPALVAALIVVPYYVRPSQAGIVAHLKAVAQASPVPVIVYNIAYRTGRNLEAAGLIELANTPNFAGVKQSATGLGLDSLELLAGTNGIDGFAVLGGEDPFLLPMVLMGAAGTICASAHVCTSRFVELTECGLAAKVDEGRVHAEALLPLTQSLFSEPNPAVFKGVLHAQGRIPTPDVRLPLVNASDAAVQRALDDIARAS
ncbi:MAG TPA: dihydrodipicolinate synthase family protein [Acidimicrobiia bacterium]